MRLLFGSLLLFAAPAVADDATDRLVAALRDTDRGVRYAAVQALGKARAALPQVVLMLEDPEWCVRQAAGTAVRRFGAAAASALTRVLRAGSLDARVEAMEAFGWMGKAGIPTLLKGLDDKEPRIVLEALDGLWRSQEHVTTLPINQLLAWAEDKEQERKLMACLLLEKFAPEHRHVAWNELHGCTGADKHGKPRGLAQWALDSLFEIRKKKPLKDVAIKLPTEPALDDLATAELTEANLIAIGRHRDKARHLASHVRAQLTSKDARLRGAATWALGRMGIEVPAMLRDADPVVRELAVATIGHATALKLLESRDVTERRLAARVAVTEASMSDPDVVVRIEAARKLGKGLDDKERDVRIAAALKSGDPRALDDPNIRVRTAALRSIRTAPNRVAPYLEHGDPYISQLAADALVRMKAAEPVAARLGSAHVGVLHYAPRIYEAIGKDAAATVPTLIPLLKHEDVNVREVAARCLGATRSRQAAAALIEALSDRRLPVVAHAATALGRIGITAELLAALDSKRARVRAYAAFAIGQARADTPAPYEPRLPVLDCAEAGVLTKAQWASAKNPKSLKRDERIRVCREGIKSSDPAIAIPCAAALDFDEMGPWATERCVELLAPEGFREGNPIDFDKYRSYLGSIELPATIEYLFYPRSTKPNRSDIYAHLHRSSHALNIPALLWFEGRYDHIRAEGFGEMTQPYWYTKSYGKERGIDRIWEFIETDRQIWQPDRWWINDLKFGNERARLLVDIAARNAGKSNAWVAVRLLARLDDAYSERFLETVDDQRHFALAALARRGHPAGLAELVEAAAEDVYALGLLIEFRPRLAAEILRAKLPDAEWARLVHRAQSNASYVGVRWRSEDLLGIEPLLDLESASADAIVSTAALVPGCRTKRLAEAAFRKLDKLPATWTRSGNVQTPDANSAFLWSADPARTVALFRTWARSEDARIRGFALRRLYWMSDLESAPLIARWIEDGARTRDLAAWETPRGLRVPAIRRAFKAEPWPELFRLTDSEEPDPKKWLEQDPQAIWGNYDYKRTPWMRTEIDRRWLDRGIASTPFVLMQLALWPDKHARADLWSVNRAGRYRWVVYSGDKYDLTLGRDFSTLPHWIDALESNCCVVSGRLASTFEDWFGIESIYGCESRGVGQSPAERVHDWFQMYGGDLVWCPMFEQFVAKPD